MFTYIDTQVHAINYVQYFELCCSTQDDIRLDVITYLCKIPACCVIFLLSHVSVQLNRASTAFSFVLHAPNRERPACQCDKQHHTPCHQDLCVDHSSRYANPPIQAPSTPTLFSVFHSCDSPKNITEHQNVNIRPEINTHTHTHENTDSHAHTHALREVALTYSLPSAAVAAL
jgi:hypothetical protein